MIVHGGNESVLILGIQVVAVVDVVTPKIRLFSSHGPQDGIPSTYIPFLDDGSVHVHVLLSFHHFDRFETSSWGTGSSLRNT